MDDLNGRVTDQVYVWRELYVGWERVAAGLRPNASRSRLDEIGPF